MAMTSPARQEIAATMAAPLMQTDWMAALARARKVGVVPAATLILSARLRRIAVATAQLKTRIQPMVVIASAILDGKAMLARPR